MGQRVGRGIALLFHDRGTRRGWVVSSTPRPHFTLGKDPVPILQVAGWAPGPVWTGGKSRPHRDSILDRPTRSQSLYRLSYPAHIDRIHNNTYYSINTAINYQPDHLTKSTNSLVLYFAIIQLSHCHSLVTSHFTVTRHRDSRSQQPRSLRRGSAVALPLRLWVRIPPGAWMPVCSECCVLSGRGLSDELITRPEESYRLWCVVVCNLGTS